MRHVGVMLGAATVALVVTIGAMNVHAGRAEPASDLLPALQATRSDVRDVLDSNQSPWAKALAVNAIVKEATPPIYSGYFCDQYARWFLELVGDDLEARMVTGMVDPSNRVDTHTTIEVWLPKERRWVVVDPTFGGHFEVNGRPIGAHDLQRLLLAGKRDRVRWVSSHVENSAMLSEYYVDSTLLFRHVYMWKPNAEGRIVRVETERSRVATQSLASHAPVYAEMPAGRVPRFSTSRED